MARQKNAVTVQRTPSGKLQSELHDATTISDAMRQHVDSKPNGFANGHTGLAPSSSSSSSTQGEAGLLQLLICVGGIYASFLSWAVLQERITTTPYPIQEPTILEPNPPTERFTYSLVINTIQSLFAATTGLMYLVLSTPKGQKIPSIIPTRKIVGPLFLISLTSSLASPFGYASLAHIDYLTFILAKSCKLLPVMFLHLAIFQKRYPLYKYCVVLAVTLGVATFTLYHPGSAAKAAKHAAKSSSSNSKALGLALLAINLIFDGLTNTVQDHIFTSPKLYTKFSGPQMMVAQNLASTLLTGSFLLLAPFLPTHPHLLPIPDSTTLELQNALSFLSRHPSVLNDILGFAACGAVGQVFIFYTLSKFSSLLLVTVTVTRKMLTMLLSVVWFGHTLSAGQWVGVALVFGGVGAEGWVGKKEKDRKKKEMEKGLKKEL